MQLLPVVLTWSSMHMTLPVNEQELHVFATANHTAYRCRLPGHASAVRVICTHMWCSEKALQQGCWNFQGACPYDAMRERCQ